MHKLGHMTIKFVKHNAPTILTVIGSAGVVATAVATAKATPKAIKLIEEETEEKGSELAKFEKFKVAAPAYVPAVILGVGTVACIVGSNKSNKKQQAALSSAYALLDKSYKAYKEKVVELYGEEGDRKIKTEIAKDIYNEKKEESTDKELFYDEYGKRYFESTMEQFEKSKYELNRIFHTTDVVTLNDWYGLLGISPIDGGELIGWTIYETFQDCWGSWIDFNIHKVEMEDGIECNIIEAVYDPYDILDSDYFSRR